MTKTTETSNDHRFCPEAVSEPGPDHRDQETRSFQETGSLNFVATHQSEDEAGWHRFLNRCAQAQEAFGLVVGNRINCVLPLRGRGSRTAVTLETIRSKTGLACFGKAQETMVRWLPVAVAETDASGRFAGTGSRTGGTHLGGCSAIRGFP